LQEVSLMKYEGMIQEQKDISYATMEKQFL